MERFAKVYLYFSKFTPARGCRFKSLSPKDKRRVKRSPSLLQNPNFISSRELKRLHKSRKFALSHKNGLSVLCRSKIKVCVDLEELKERNYEGVMEFCFMDDEREFVRNSFDTKLAFYQVFTTKEATIKYKNLGFESLDKVSYFDKKFSKFHIQKDNYLITVLF